MAISPSGGSSQAAAESASPASGSGSIGSGEATSNLPNIGIAQPNEGDSGSKMTPVRKLYNTRYLKLLLIIISTMVGQSGAAPTNVVEVGFAAYLRTCASNA